VRSRKILVVVGVVAGLLGLLLGLAAVGGFVWLRSGGRPQREGEARIPGLHGPVTVRWDRWGVPHVTAEVTKNGARGAELDLARALGWLHANDRMSQMELGRRAAAGRLSEVFGERTLEMDRHVRTLGLGELAERLAGSSRRGTRARLEAYAAGVNAWLDARGGDLPPELRLLGIDPEPWRPADSLGFALLLAHDLSFWFGRPEEARFQWLVAFGPEGLRDLTGEPEIHIPPAIAELAREIDATPRESVSPEPALGGSNNWALAGERTATGVPLVANDPHLPLRLPSTWYQVLLRSHDPQAHDGATEGGDLGEPPYEAAGVTLPGLPGVVIGRNRDLAWGFTHTMLDDHDLTFERLRDDGPGEGSGSGLQVLRREGPEPVWLPVEERVERIQVRGGEDVELRLRATDRGPLLPAEPERSLPARSLAWTPYRASDLVAGFLGLARARRVEEIPDALAFHVGPAQNLVAADRHGGLLYTVMGRVPVRRTGDGRLPSPGWNPDYGWDGLRPQATNPTVLDPADGLLVTANADHRPPGYPLPFVGDFDLPHRAERIRELLASRDGWRAEELSAVQTDVVSLYARRVVRILRQEEWAGPGAEERQPAEVLRRLTDWDGEMRGAEAALFEVLEREIGDAVFGDEAEAQGLRGLARRHRILRALEGGMERPWFDDVRTERIESRRETLTRALTAAWRAMRRIQGDDPSRWRWQAMQRLVLEHPLTELPLLGRWFGRGPFPTAGSAATPDAKGGRWRKDGTKATTYAPSLRWIVDLADPDGGLAVLPGGQSGHPADPHYDDQLGLYLNGRLRPVPWSDEAIEAATVSRLRLVP